MASTLTSIRDRVEVYLQDSTNLIFTTATIDEGINLALQYYNQVAGGTAQTINGLNGASSTTISEGVESAVVIGGAGYAVQARTIDRAEAFNLGEKVPAALLAWGQAQIERFEKWVGLACSEASTLEAAQIDKITAEIGKLEAEQASIEGIEGRAAAKAASESAKVTAEIGKLGAEQASLEGAESRAAADAIAAAAEKAAEAARLAELHGATAAPYPSRAVDDTASGWEIEE